MPYRLDARESGLNKEKNQLKNHPKNASKKIVIIKKSNKTKFHGISKETGTLLVKAV